MPLKIEKLSNRFGNKWILRDVAFEAAEGRVFGICGATASGKSTILNAIDGNGKINGGSITLGSLDMTAVKAKDRNIQLLTSKETAGLLGIFGGGSQKDSSGERQVAAFEEMIAKASKVLLLDDPFCQMDEHLKQKCFEKVRQSATSRGRIVIFASSDFDQIASLADETAILSGGDIKQIGTPQEIYENPETVAAVQISGGANFIIARRLTSTDADLPEFQTIDGSHRIFAQRSEKSRLGAINQNMTLAIRPEQILMSMGASFPEDNLLKAFVTDIKFRGSTSLIEFDAAGLKLETRVFKIVGLNIGDECMLGLPPHRIIVLKD